MTARLAIGLTLLAAEVAVLAYVMVPLLLRYRRVCREWSELDEARREWDEHIATTPGLEPVERDFLRWEASL